MVMPLPKFDIRVIERNMNKRRRKPNSAPKGDGKRGPSDRGGGNPKTPGQNQRKGGIGNWPTDWGRAKGGQTIKINPREGRDWSKGIQVDKGFVFSPEAKDKKKKPSIEAIKRRIESRRVM